MDSNSTTAQQLIMAEAVEALGLREKLIEMGWVPPKEAALLMAQVAAAGLDREDAFALGEVAFELGVPAGAREDRRRSCLAAIRSLKNQDAGDAERYTCIGKGGSCLFVGYASPAGTIRQSSHGERMITVYQDAITGKLYFRSIDDFTRRMERISQV